MLNKLRNDKYSLELFSSDLDMASVQVFVNKHCVLCGDYFTSDHELGIFTKYPTDILKGLDMTQIQTDF